MKNTSSGPEESFFKKKGFFVALYSTLGAVMVLALVVTFTNLTAGPAENELTGQAPVLDDSVNVNTDDVETIDQLEADRERQDEQAWWRSTPKPSQPAATPAPAKPPGATAAPVITPAPAAPKPAAPAVPSTAVTPTPDTSPKPEANAEQEEEETETAAFTPFEEDDKMLWPLEGDIAMAYSMDKLIYDPTLDQYRVNDDIRISAQEGTPVKASADGQVLEIGRNNVDGTFITIDHGNGWISSYGQLMDGVLVDQGEVVKAGQVIGGVGQPSIYGSLNGTHLSLHLTKENEPVDPTGLLAAEE